MKQVMNYNKNKGLLYDHQNRPHDHEDGWAYNAGKDVITGYLDLTSPSLITSFPYRFELTRTELMLFF